VFWREAFASMCLQSYAVCVEIKVEEMVRWNTRCCPNYCCEWSVKGYVFPPCMQFTVELIYLRPTTFSCLSCVLMPRGDRYWCRIWREVTPHLSAVREHLSKTVIIVKGEAKNRSPFTRSIEISVAVRCNSILKLYQLMCISDYDKAFY